MGVKFYHVITIYIYIYDFILIFVSEKSISKMKGLYIYELLARIAEVVFET